MLKKGVSAVIATVLLIMITISAVALIAGIIIPFVKNQLGTGKSCFEAIDQLSIETGKFTCYTSENTSVMIRRGTNAKFEMKGIIVSLTRDDGSTMVYRIENNSILWGVKMYNGGSLILPQAGGAETYIFDIISGYISVAPILPNGDSCKEVSENIETC